MSEPKHSPGPWRWYQEAGRRMPILRASDDTGVIIWGRDFDSCEYGDKALIAAAPDMAAMLRELEWQFNDRAGVGVCPSCRCTEDVGYGGGHAPDCRLASLLKALP
jgi:hypothetical protein